MGQQLAETIPAAQRLYDQAADVLGYDLAKICFEGPEEQLDSTVISQPALFVTSLAALESLRLESPAVVEACAATAGLSLGEYTAMVFAGVMEFEDALRVVQRRGEAMQAAADAVASGMVSILGLELGQVEQLCAESRQEGEILEVANHLCPGNIAISGHATACERAAEKADAYGAMKAVPLAVAGAFHTELMRSRRGPTAGGPGQRADAAAANSGRVQCGCSTPRGSRRDPPTADPAGRFARAVGGFDAVPAGPRRPALLRDRTGTGVARIAQTHSTQSPVR